MGNSVMKDTVIYQKIPNNDNIIVFCPIINSGTKYKSKCPSFSLNGKRRHVSALLDNKTYLDLFRSVNFDNIRNRVSFSTLVQIFKSNLGEYLEVHIKKKPQSKTLSIPKKSKQLFNFYYY